MLKGKRLREKYTGLICIVEEVYVDHMLLLVEGSSLPWLVRKEQYKDYEEAEDYTKQ